MKKLQNVLYILTPNSYLHCQNETIAVHVGGDEKVRIPSHTIESIVCYGNTTVSTPFIAFCGERNIGLSFMSDYGRFYGRVNGPVSGNVLLRRGQYRLMDDADYSVNFVRLLMYGKLSNSKNLLLRSAREHEGIEESGLLRDTALQLAHFAQKLQGIDSIDSLRGIEGVGASTYFGVFDHMIKAQKSDFFFNGRSKYPPEDNVNSVLSFLYILLKNDVQSALEAVGLDPAAGFMHTLRPGRASLALDLMEELRAPICDRLTISLINLKQISNTGFHYEPSGVKLSDKARRVVIDAWQRRKKEEILHPFLDKKIQIGLIPFAQAQLLARNIRGDLDAYPPFIWR